MEQTKGALLDTDFISKLCDSRIDEDNCMMDRVLEVPGYRFFCHEQIIKELSRYDGTARSWLEERTSKECIKKYTDAELLEILWELFGQKAIIMYLSCLKKACDICEHGIYESYYAVLEHRRYRKIDFLQQLGEIERVIGSDHNLGEIKTYLLRQVLAMQGAWQLYMFCSDDRRARTGMLVLDANVPCMSALTSFCFVRAKLGMDKSEAKKYYDAWMQLHLQKGQSSFKVHNNTKAMQLIRMDGYEVFERIYDGSLVPLKNGNLKLKTVVLEQ